MFRVGALQAVVHRHRAKTRRARVQIREVQRGRFGVAVFNLAVFNLAVFNLAVFNLAVFNLAVFNNLGAFPFLFLLRCALFRLGEAVRDGGVSRHVHFRKRAQPRARSALLQPPHDVQHVDPPLVRVHAQPSNGDGHLDASSERSDASTNRAASSHVIVRPANANRDVAHRVSRRRRLARRTPVPRRPRRRRRRRGHPSRAV